MKQAGKADYKSAIVDTRGAAQIIGVTPSTVCRLVKDGLLKPVIGGGGRRPLVFNVADLMRHIEPPDTIRRGKPRTRKPVPVEIVLKGNVR